MRTVRSITTLAALLFCAATAFSQHPRMMLVEEGTNASCPPCARENPTFEKYLESPHILTKVIPVVYHASWPGRDVMYSANPAMHTARIVDYYRISGVPTVVVNGRLPSRVTGGWDGAPSDTIAINNALAGYSAVSPLSFEINEQASGADVSLEVKVSSTSALSGKKLRIVVVEGHHYYASAGTNGEKNFYYIARLMLPSAAGVDFSIGADETKSFNHAFQVDTAWNSNEIYVVAFVQDDATREVLQAATDRLHMDFKADDPVALSEWAGGPHSFDATLKAPAAGEYSLATQASMPAAWTHEIRIDGAPVALPATLTLEKDQSLEFALAIAPSDSKNRLGSVDVEIRGPLGASARESFRLYARDITAPVLVMDEGNPAIAASYAAALERGPHSYALVGYEDLPVFNLNAFGALVCEVGKNVLTEQDVTLLKSFLDHGGRLFLIGAEIAWGLADPDASTSGFYSDPGFLRDYLRADYVRDDNPASTVRGVPGDPIGDGFNISFTTGIQNQDTPDEIAPRAGASPVLYYGAGNEVAGIRYDDAQNRILYFGFGLEGIGLVVSRGEILSRGISWLLAPVSVESEFTTPDQLSVDLYPQPSAGWITVPLQASSASFARIAVYDMAGRLTAAFPPREIPAGNSELRIDLTDIPAGDYIIHVAASGAATSRAFRIFR